MENILFITDLRPNYYFGLSHRSVLENMLGGRVDFIEFFDFFDDLEKSFRLEDDFIQTVLAEKIFSSLDLVSINEKFLTRILNCVADTVYFYGLSHCQAFLFPQTLHEIRKAGKKVVLSSAGDHFGGKSHFPLYWLPLCDVMTSRIDATTVKYNSYANKMVDFPVGPPRVYDFDLAKDIDVLFVGRPFGPRAQLIASIIKKIGSDKNICIYGSRAWENDPRIKPFYKGYLPNEIFHETYARAKISLALTENIGGGTPHINAKVFDASAVGTFSIANRVPMFESYYGFKDGESIAFYTREEELPELVDHYLRNPQIRERIASKSRELIANFTNDKIWERLLIDIRKKNAGSRPERNDQPDYSPVLTAVIPANAAVPTCVPQGVEVCRPGDREIRGRFVVVLAEGTDEVDSELPRLLTWYDKKLLLNEVNVFWSALPGLVINYPVPSTFRSIICQRDIFLKNQRVLSGRNAFLKVALMLLFLCRGKVKVLPVIAVHNRFAFKTSYEKAMDRLVKRLRMWRNGFFQ